MKEENFLSYKQLIEKYPELKSIFFNEEFLKVLLRTMFIQGYALTPKEIELGNDYELSEADLSVSEEEMTYFYHEKSVFKLVDFRNNAIENLLNSNKDSLKGKG